MTQIEDFDRFMKRREVAALAYVRGDPDSVVALTVRKDPASFFAPDSSSSVGSVAPFSIVSCSTAAAIANAVYHATGIRVRELPIRLEKILT